MTRGVSPYVQSGSPLQSACSGTVQASLFALRPGLSQEEVWRTKLK